MGWVIVPRPEEDQPVRILLFTCPTERRFIGASLCVGITVGVEGLGEMQRGIAISYLPDGTQRILSNEHGVFRCSLLFREDWVLTYLINKRDQSINSGLFYHS